MPFGEVAKETNQIVEELLAIDGIQDFDVRTSLISSGFSPRERNFINQKRPRANLAADLKHLVEWAVQLQKLSQLVHNAMSLTIDPKTKEKLRNVLMKIEGLVPTESVEADVENPGKALGKKLVLIVTITKVEATAVLNFVKDRYGYQYQINHHKNKTYYNLGKVASVPIFMVRSEMGASGSSGAALTVQQAIDFLNPSAIIMVGIAFGLDPDKQRLGDVLVSRQLMNYGPQRVGAESVIPRGDRTMASARLLDRFRHGELTWSVAPVHIGLILSGPKLVDNIDYRNELKSLEPEAIGGEMEGSGLYDSASAWNVDWILVKAICDWADGRKHENKEENQLVAAKNATSFVFHVLEQGGFNSE